MTGARKLPDGLLLAFYGDDFTGSSAVMEVMTFAGLPAAMFVGPPTPQQLQRFSGRRAIGVASVARAQSPAWMAARLPAAFTALEALGAPVAHYKVCSTLDSSPTLGSIGQAIDIGAPIFGGRPGAANWQPLVVAAPAIGRYQAFGNLFATLGAETHRLDRHPVMQNHPATPMREADVRRHIGEQTARGVGLIDYVTMKNGGSLARLESELRAGRGTVALDVIDDESLRLVGELIWTRRGAGIFVIGSQGIEYALVAYWRAAGLLPDAPTPAAAAEARQIIACSGSVSAVTAAQIDWAEAHGFESIPLEAAAVFDRRAWAAAVEAAKGRAREALSRGRSPLIATARGPDDPAVGRFRAAGAPASDPEAADANARIGEALGGLLRCLADETGVQRGAISGGDSAGFAVRALGAYALEPVAPIAAGAPLCRAHSTDASVDGLEVVLKGGQMGQTNFFGSVRAGRVSF